MTTYTENRTTDTSTNRPLFAALGVGVAIVLTALGTFWDLTGNEPDSTQGWEEFLPVIGVILVAAAIVFGLAVRPGPQAGTRAIVLAVLSVLSLVVFWSGLPAVLAAGSVANAVAARGSDGALTSLAKASIGISAVALALAVAAAIAG